MNKMRNISFLDEFKEDGLFYCFTKLVKNKDNGLELLFRGNSGDNGQAVIYYRNNVVFRLSVSSRSAKITINYDHLRYTKEWPKMIKKYEKYGFPHKNEKNIKPNKYYGIGYVNALIPREKAKEIIDDNYVKGLFDISKEVMKDYFSHDKSKLKDWFRDSVNEGPTGRAKPDYLEKENQQAYFSENSNVKNGLFIYDLEYKEAFENTTEKNISMKSKGREKMNKPDCLGIRFDKDGNPINFVFVEIKSNKNAEIGESGTEEHLDGMMDDLTDSSFVQMRIKEAEQIIHDYQKIGLKGLSKETVIPDFNPKRITPEIVIVYTDNAACNKQAGKQRAKSMKYEDGIEYTVEFFKTKKE